MIEKPIAKITAAILLLGSVGAYFFLVLSDVELPSAGFAFVGGLAGSAATFLFMSEVIPSSQRGDNNNEKV